MALFLTTYTLANAEAPVNVFTRESHIRCECGSGAGYLEQMDADVMHTMGTLTWTCSICSAENREPIMGAHVREAFRAFGVTV